MQHVIAFRKAREQVVSSALWLPFNSSYTGGFLSSKEHVFLLTASLISLHFLDFIL